MADQQSIQNLSNQAAAAMNARDWLSLLKISEQWRALDPESQDAARNMTFAYFELGDGEKARDSYRMILDANSGSAQHLGIYARFCLAAFDYEGACEALEEAHKVSQPTAETLYALARAKTFLGDLAEAEELAAQAIDANPNYSLGYVQYSTLRGGDVDEAKAAKMLELGADLSIAPEHRASLFFALGDIHHYKEDYEAAMRCYNAGNHVSGEILAAERQLYAPDNFETIRAREGKLYSKAPEAMDFVAGPATPIFVIGMPRSGTTLIESILAAHPDAYGAGELATLPVIHNKALRWSAENSGATLATAPKEMLQEWREEYFASYPGNLDAPYVVDKQPLNFRAVGLIKTLFPEATIIHIRRNPVDTGFSIYKNDFAKAWPYATNQEHIAHFYGEYARIIGFWESAMRDAFTTFQYEDLISDFETSARLLLERCGLDWRDECLAFHEVKRPVATFSTTQVRQPIRKAPVSAEAKYGALLKPLKDGLAQAGVDLETGALKV